MEITCKSYVIYRFSEANPQQNKIRDVGRDTAAQESSCLENIADKFQQVVKEVLSYIAVSNYLFL